MEKNEKEDEFVCRTYGKSELAQLYCPIIAIEFLKSGCVI